MKKFIYLTFILTTLMTLMFTFSAHAAVEQPISFLQDDSEWGSESYSVVGSRSQTIATSGCGPTSMAMVLNYYINKDGEGTFEVVPVRIQNGYPSATNNEFYKKRIFATLGKCPWHCGSA